MDIPLFPLHTVLCPGIALPLHVFEERYRRMVAACLANGSPFGVVLIRQGTEVGDSAALAIAAVGTLAEIRQAERLPDGRYELLVVGGRRFAVEDVVVGREPYLVASVTLLAEDVGDEERAHALVRRVTPRFVRYLRLVQPRAGEAAERLDVQLEIEVEGADEEVGPSDEGGITRRVVVPDDPTVLAHLLAGIVDVEPLRRQALLEAATTVERLELLDELLDRETRLLGLRLRPFAADARVLAVRRN